MKFDNLINSIQFIKLCNTFNTNRMIKLCSSLSLQYNRTLVEAVEPMFKVIVVRNPITKLLSGYKDKVKR